MDIRTLNSRFTEIESSLYCKSATMHADHTAYTDRITWNTRISHLAPEVRVDGYDESLHQKAAIERDVVEVDSLGFVIYCSLPRFGIS